MFGKHLAVAGSPQATRITRVMVGHLLVQLVTSQHDFVRVDDDDVIALIHMRSERRLMLPTKEGGDLRRQTTKDDTGSVNDVPLLLSVPRLG